MADGGKRDAATVLLELLEIVPDAAKLERMLEPANLLRILKASGMGDEAIRAALKERLPGDLLLEVLRKKEQDPEALLALCTTPVQPQKAPKPASAPATARAEAFGEVSLLNKISSYALLFAVIIPAMAVAGFFPEWDALSLEGWIAFATAAAALFGAGYVMGRAPWYVGALGGALVAPGALLAIYFYTRDRETVLRIEIALAFLVGAAPGALVYYALFKKVAGRQR
jgi:hypothetical protein